MVSEIPLSDGTRPATESPVVGPPHSHSSGTYTFLFTDIESSTEHWQAHPDEMREALAQHDTLLRREIARRRGQVFKTIGDAFCATFPDADQAILAAISVQRLLAPRASDGDAALRVRMALNTGVAYQRDGDYFGPALSLAARLLGLAHGGQILASTTTQMLVGAGLLTQIELRDLGAYRLKGIEHPERAFQIAADGIPSDFPPLNAVVSALTNLPLDLADFVGREAETAEIVRLLSKCRLMTLLGPGGIGKTRLAMHVAAREFHGYPDGVWMASFESVRDNGLAWQTVATALGIKEMPGRATSDTLCEVLATKNLLLLIDNCEHLIDECGELITSLLKSCPKLTILATSRETINVDGECKWRVPALSVPSGKRATPEELQQSDAARLFIQRVLAASPTFEVTGENAPVIAAICARLDGIPLALELAAARVSALTLDQISKRLEDRFRLLSGGSRNALPRRKTLRATLDWSYDLLDPAERMLLMRLSVFVGGWSLEAAETVCASDDLAADEVLDVLVRLVDKSMVVFDEGQSRYRLLETIRQYAAEHLREESDEPRQREAHAHWCGSLAKAAQPELSGANQAVWLNELETEIGNLRAALEFTLKSDDPAPGLLLAVDLYRFWSIRGYFAEGFESLSRALARSGPTDSLPRRATALSRAGVLACLQCHYSVAQDYFSQSLALYKEMDDVAGVADITNNMGQLAADMHDPETARRLLEESLVLWRDLDDREGIATSLGNLALLALMENDHERAAGLYRECLTIDRTVGDHWAIATTLDGFGRVVCRAGDFEEARKHLTESLLLRIEIADRSGVAEGLEAFAGLCAAQNVLHKAILLWGAAEARREDLHVTIPSYAERDYLEAVDLARRHVPDGSFRALWERGRSMAQDEACTMALEAERVDVGESEAVKF